MGGGKVKRRTKRYVDAWAWKSYGSTNIHWGREMPVRLGNGWWDVVGRERFMMDIGLFFALTGKDVRGILPPTRIRIPAWTVLDK